MPRKQLEHYYPISCARALYIYIICIKLYYGSSNGVTINSCTRASSPNVHSLTNRDADERKINFARPRARRVPHQVDVSGELLLRYSPTPVPLLLYILQPVAACIVQSRVAPLARGIKDRVSPMEYKNVCEKSYSYCRRVAATAARASPSTFREDDGCAVKIFGLVQECCHKISSKNIDYSRRYRELKLKFETPELLLRPTPADAAPLTCFLIQRIKGLQRTCRRRTQYPCSSPFGANPIGSKIISITYLHRLLESFIRRDTPRAREQSKLTTIAYSTYETCGHARTAATVDQSILAADLRLSTFHCTTSASWRVEPSNCHATSLHPDTIPLTWYFGSKMALDHLFIRKHNI
ncbi:unnamed protein product [Trichogramma brassicae]|uniref:Uncharacterized protein n=1 Tax=Trichogramma brassicae TaxID=86971 RepID=A0A6H5J183_9HYME|nr:unnamed protein product [Trichogramma brassicae]